MLEAIRPEPETPTRDWNAEGGIGIPLGKFDSTRRDRKGAGIRGDERDHGRSE